MSRKKKSRNQINQENGKLGAGQHTPEGIENSKWNNFKHGGRSKVIFAPWEDFNEFREHCLTYIQGYNPYDLLEMDIIMDVAGINWRKNRFACNEIDAYSENGHDLDKLLKQLNWISLYENRASLQEARKLKEFRKVHDERLSSLREPMSHYELEELRAKFTTMLHRVESPEEAMTWNTVNWREIAPSIIDEMERRGFLQHKSSTETTPDDNGMPHELEAYIQWLQDQQASRNQSHLEDVMMALDGPQAQYSTEAEPSPPGDGSVIGHNPALETSQSHIDDVVMAIDGPQAQYSTEAEPSPPGEGREMGPNPELSPQTQPPTAETEHFASNVNFPENAAPEPESKASSREKIGNFLSRERGEDHKEAS